MEIRVATYEDCRSLALLKRRVWKQLIEEFIQIKN